MTSWKLPLATLVTAFAGVAYPVHAQEDAADKLPPPIAAAPDELSGHFILAPRVAYLVPTGSAENGLKQRRFVRSGVAFGGDLAYGISRYVALQLRFDYGVFGESNDCPAGGRCSAQALGFGVGVDYHLINGATFDPWMRAGVGYRVMTFDLAWSGYDPGKLTYQGVEWLHLAVGGDWYAAQNFGFGPYMSLDIGWYGTRPDSTTVRPTVEPPGSSHHTFFAVGLRGVIDPMR